MTYGTDYETPPDWCDTHAVTLADCGCRRGPFIDVAAVIANGLPEPPAPVVLRREDGNALFYRRQVNVIFGDPECGKTWIAFAAVAEELAGEGSALIIDADHNGVEQILSRLIALGVSPDTLADSTRFRLAEPEDGKHLHAAIRETRDWAPTVAVVDSVGEILPLLGLNSNSPDDYTIANRQVLVPLALAGAAVIAIDHLAKSPDSRQAGPTGTAAKGRTPGGVSLRVVAREPFAPGRGGCAALSIKKDRPGGLRRYCPTVGGAEQPAGLFILTEIDGRLGYRVTTPTEADALTASEVSGRPDGAYWTVTDEDLAELDGLPAADRQSVRKVAAATGWGTNRAHAVLRTWRSVNGDPS
jgi:hypothetical protein